MMKHLLVTDAIL